MSKINDGGAAFPSDRFGNTGMRLRDWFAGQIAAANEATEDGRVYDKRCGMTLEQWRAECFKEDAEYCYARADAMIAAREAKGGEA